MTFRISRPGHKWDGKRVKYLGDEFGLWAMRRGGEVNLFTPDEIEIEHSKLYLIWNIVKEYFY